MNDLFAFDLGEAAVVARPTRVAGVDEAGRGALAGPLVAAAVCFEYECWEAGDFAALADLTDSKRVRRCRREELLAEIIPRAVQIVVTARNPGSIDGRGLHVCNLEALAAALSGLRPPPTVAFVDGFTLRDCCVSHRAVVGGDGRSAAVAAASIVAKVTRDRLMRRLHDQYPEWGFIEHVGYATRSHQDAIVRYGLCPLHRRSFKSVSYQQLRLGEEDPPWNGDEGDEGRSL